MAIREPYPRQNYFYDQFVPLLKFNEQSFQTQPAMGKTILSNNSPIDNKKLEVFIFKKILESLD